MLDKPPKYTNGTERVGTRSYADALLDAAGGVIVLVIGHVVTPYYSLPHAALLAAVMTV